MELAAAENTLHLRKKSTKYCSDYVECGMLWRSALGCIAQR